jgi:hypothetical protein
MNMAEGSELNHETPNQCVWCARRESNPWLLDEESEGLTSVQDSEEQGGPQNGGDTEVPQHGLSAV